MRHAFILLALFSSPREPLAQLADGARTDLFLSVVLNGVIKNQVARFTRQPDGSLEGTGKELREIGLAVAADDAHVPLNAVPGIRYSLDAAAQSIHIDAEMKALAPNEFDLVAITPPSTVQASNEDYGFLLNYDLLAASSNDQHGFAPAYGGMSANLEMRGFSPYGILTQTGILGNTAFETGMSAVRLDTTFTNVDASNERIVRAGDVISGGLAWTRPVRLGGGQVERNFGLRPGLVTMPLPTLSGTAAVPSSLDLYINGVKAFTRDVPAGPFQLNNVPVVTGAGTTRLLLRDVSGHESQNEVAYFASTKLLRPGLYDYSVEVGMPRLDYAAESFSYGHDPAASISGRFGLTNDVTLEGHAEATPKLAGAGGGINVKTGSNGVLSMAAAGSASQDGTGALVYGAYELRLGSLSLNFDSQRTLDSYRDMAAVTFSGNRPRSGLNKGGYFDVGSVLPAKSIDRASVSLPIDQWSSSLIASFTRYDDGARKKSQIVSLSFSGQLLYRGSFFSSLIYDFSGINGIGVFAGLSFPFGDDGSASATVASGDHGARLVSQANKFIRDEPGSLGWSVTDSRGESPLQAARVDYRTSVGVVGGGISQSGENLAGTAHMSGSVVALAGGGMHLAPTIEDGFAIVKAGAPGVPVMVENRKVGVTDRNGELVVTRLRTNEDNRIDIDPTVLPVDAVVRRSKTIAKPALRGGLLIDFGVDTKSPAARIRLVDKDGRDVPPGTSGTVNGGPLVVGYDGEAYLTNLKSRNDIVLELPDGDCRATFVLDGSKGARRLPPVACIRDIPSSSAAALLGNQ